MQTKEMLYKSTIKDEYGLTESWIKKLGDPDKIVRNPHYTSQSSFLYRRDRVEQLIADNRSAYDRLLERRQTRSERALAVANKRRQQTIDFANTVEIIFYRQLPTNQTVLERAAINAHQDFQLGWRNNPDCSFTVTFNAVVAFVRHNMSNYDELLSLIKNKNGTSEAYEIIESRVNTRIKNMLIDQYGNDIVDLYYHAD